MDFGSGTTRASLQLLGIVAGTCISHLAASATSWVAEWSEFGAPMLWLASGLSVGLFVRAKKPSTAIAVLAGGVLGQIAFGLMHDATPLASGVATHVVEVAVSLAFLLLALRTSDTASEPIKVLTASASFMVAVSLSYAVSSTASPALFWMLSRGAGLFLVFSVVVLTQDPWLAGRSPKERPAELGVLALAFALALLAAVFVLRSAAVGVIGLCLIGANRFGTRLGQPLALCFALTIVLANARSLGEFQRPGVGVYSRIGPPLAVAFLTSVAGRLAVAADGQLTSVQGAARRWKKLSSRGFEAFIELDAGSHVDDLSESARRYFDLRSGGVRGVALLDLVDDALWSHIDSAINQAKQGSSVRFEQRIDLAAAGPFSCLFIVEAHTDKRGNYSGCTIDLLDTTHIHRRNIGRVEARALIAETQDAERRRLAQLVHDGALQDLAAANLLVGSARMDAEQNPDRLTRIEALLVSGMRKLRNDAIGPDTIDVREVDVVASLEETVAKFRALNSAEIRVREHGDARASPDVRRTVLKIAREAVVNAILHSYSTLIDVDVSHGDQGLLIVIVDDGIGFDPSQLHELGHLGLGTMSSLSQDHGGWFSLSTRPGGGTTVEAWLPNDDPHSGVPTGLLRFP